MYELLELFLLDAFFASIAGFGFAYLSSPPKNTLIFSALLAAIGHSTRFLMLELELVNITFATLLASFLVGICGMFFALKLKVPAEIIAFPSLLPMIPGIYAYKSILALFMFLKSDEMEQKSQFLILFFDNAATTASVILSLGVGVSVTLLLFYERALMSTRGARAGFKFKNTLKIKK